MAAGGRFDEAVRLSFQLEGKGAAQDAAKLLDQIGDAGEEAQQKAAGLLDEFSDVQKLQAATKGFREAGQAALQLGRDLQDAKDRAAALSQEITNSDKPTKQQLANYERSQRVIKATNEDYQAAVTRLKAYRGTLSDAGISATRLGTAERELSRRIGDVGRGLSTLRDDTVALAAARAQSTARLRDEDEAFRRQAVATRTSSEALKGYRDRAAQAARGTNDLASAGENAGGTFSRLRGLFAGALAFISVQSLAQGIKGLLGVGAAAEDAQRSLGNLYGSQEKGNQAFARLKDIAKSNGLAFQDVLDAAKKLKAFGLDPINGSLQALIDQNAAVGGSQQDLEGKILALGQAWAKQKLQGEEILQLVERGVPVWDLLQKATGKNVDELQKLSVQGKLGRDVIAALYTEIGKANDGAAQRGLTTLTGLTAKAAAMWERFVQLVADSGVTDYFKKQLTDIGAYVDRLAQNGQLAAFAKSVASSLVTVADSIRATTVFLAQHYQSLLLIARGYAALKIARWLLELNAARERWAALAKSTLTAAGAFDAAATKSQKLGAAFKAVPTDIRIAIALIGLELAIEGAKKLGQAVAANGEAADNFAAVQERVRSEAIQQKIAMEALAKSYEAFRDQQVLTTQQAAALGDTERASYKARLEGLQQYLIGQNGYLLRLQQLGKATSDQISQQREVALQLRAVREGFLALGQAAQFASDGLRTGLSAQAQQFVATFAGIERNSKSAQQAMAKLFDGIDFFGPQAVLADIALALNEVSKSSNAAERVIKDGLLATLGQLGGQELLRFQSAAVAAFDELKQGPEETAAILDTTLLAAMQRLNVQAERLGFAFTESSRDVQAAFATVVENARSTASQVETAFNAAVGQSNTIEQLQQLGTLLAAAGEQGKLGFDATERSMAALQARIGEVQAAVDPLADTFARLGIKSQAALDSAAAAAKVAFDQIVRGAREGVAAQEDVRRAFEAYSQAARASVKDSDAYKVSFVEAQIQANSYAVVLKDTLVETGRAGGDAMNRVSTTADRASASLDDAAQSAGDAASAATALASSADGVSSAFQSNGAAAREMAASLGVGSAAYSEALLAANRFAGQTTLFARSINSTVAAYVDEAKQAQDIVSKLEAENSQYDEKAQRLAALRVQFRLLGDTQLGILDDEQQKLIQNKKRREDAAAKELEDTKRQAAAVESVADVQDRVIETKSVQTLRLEVEAVPAKDGTKFILTGDQMDQIVRRLVQVLELKKASS